jgi:hypothetical protein
MLLAEREEGKWHSIEHFLSKLYLKLPLALSGQQTQRNK